jgi:cathepsin L/KDEL-tailed cysteine endopeptidase
MMCDPFGWQECPAGNSCGCRWPFFFHLFCIRHDCCPLEGGVDCGDNLHCCPGDLPVCDTTQGTCSSQDGTKSQSWTSKQDAQLTAAGQAAQAAGRLGRAVAKQQEVAHSRQAAESQEGDFDVAVV